MLITKQWDPRQMVRRHSNAANDQRRLKTAHVKSRQTHDVSITVGVWLERTLWFYSNIVSLLFGQRSQLRAQRRKVQAGDLFIEVFREQVDLILISLVLLPIRKEIQLSQYLVRKRTRHDE